MKRKTIAIIILGIIVFIIFVFVLVMSLIKNSTAFKTAEQEIKSNLYIQQEIGEVMGFGRFPLGSLSTSDDTGNAVFTIKVFGAKKNVKVQIVLIKNSGEDWKVTDLKIR